MADLTLGLSFDDVLLVPQRSEVLPTSAVLDTALTSEISLKIPVLAQTRTTIESKIRNDLHHQTGNIR